MIKWKCYPEFVQVHGFRSVKVMLDTPSGSPKNCPEAKAEVLSKSRSIPSSPIKSSLGFGQVRSDQPTASRLEHCELVCLNSTWNLGKIESAYKLE
ncbi:hypothetical protein Bca101_049063 [Brassica carinata]